jgi:hypothetical protein
VALGNKIVINAPEAKGRYLEGIIEGTPKPGTIMQIKAATEPDAGGRFTWQAFDASGSGAPKLIAVLDYDKVQGKTATDAYVTGKRGTVYIPLPGDELNVLLDDLTGTGATSDFAIGDLLMPVDGTGLVTDAGVGTAQYTSRPFTLLETITDLTADQLVRVIFNGY